MHCGLSSCRQAMRTIAPAPVCHRPVTVGHNTLAHKGEAGRCMCLCIPVLVAQQTTNISPRSRLTRVGPPSLHSILHIPFDWKQPLLSSAGHVLSWLHTCPPGSQTEGLKDIDNAVTCNLCTRSPYGRPACTRAPSCFACHHLVKSPCPLPFLIGAQHSTCSTLQHHVMGVVQNQQPFASFGDTMKSTASGRRGGREATKRSIVVMLSPAASAHATRSLQLVATVVPFF